MREREPFTEEAASEAAEAGNDDWSEYGRLDRDYFGEHFRLTGRWEER